MTYHTPLRKEFKSIIKKYPFTQKEFDCVIAPLINSIVNKYLETRQPIVVGVQGGQGTGKSTLTKLLTEIIKKFDIEAITFSIDDFYKSIKERNKLNQDNPYYELPRGALGTHRTKVLKTKLRSLKAGKVTDLPVFNKSTNKGIGEISTKSRHIASHPQIIFFEGYCVNLPTVSYNKLKNFTNYIPEKQYVKEMLAHQTDYQDCWKHIDYQVILEEDDPSLQTKWRLKQEKTDGKYLTKSQIENFVNLLRPLSIACYKSKNFQAKIHIDNKHKLYSLALNRSK